MKIALVGYGQMGREIESIAIDRGHKIGATITSQNADQMEELIRECDVAIEFSRPDTAIANINACLNAGIPIVVGTTGWMEELDSIREHCDSLNGSLLYASNFSVGMNIFFDINRRLARLMNDQELYDVAMEEIHHTRKVDSPSGTAITLANDILDNIQRKQSWSETENGDDILSIEAKREGDVPGTHQISYSSEIDDITIRHEAKNRRGFALGAVLAAEWLPSHPGVHTFAEVLGI